MKHSMMLLLTGLIGLSIIGGTIALSNLLVEGEKTEINMEKEHIREFIQEDVESQIIHATIISDTVSAFYLGSELVTESEFAIFTSHIINNDPSMKNILVFQNNKIIQSYPFSEFVGQDSNSIGNVITHNNKKYLVLIHEEKDLEVSVILFVDPTVLVPLSTILKEPYKTILYVNDERFFAIENNQSNSNVFFTPEELTSSVNVKTAFDFKSHKAQNNLVFEYLIYESEFKNEFENIIWVILLIGTGIGALISVLFFKNVKNKEQIREKNRQLEVNSQVLKRMQSLLLVSEERYRNLFESSPLAVVTIALDGAINSFNTQACDLFGYDKNETIGQHFSKFVSDDDRQKSTKLFEEVFLLGKINNVSIICKKKNNENFEAKINASVLKDKNAMDAGVICVISPRE